MKFNRILSSVLVIVMLISCVIAALPIVASAAEEEVDIWVKENDELTTEEFQAIVEAYKSSGKEGESQLVFKTSEEMFSYDLSMGYLDHVISGGYAVYVNRYTGVMYYVNLTTGQMLTSNPIDPGYDGKAGSIDSYILSQVSLTYTTPAKADPDNAVPYDTYKNGTLEGLKPVVTAFGTGLKIDYTIGEPHTIDLVSVAFLSDDMESKIIAPAFANLASIMEKHFGAYNTSYSPSEISSYNPYLTDIDILKGTAFDYNDGVDPSVYDFNCARIQVAAGYLLAYTEKALLAQHGNDYSYESDPAFTEVRSVVEAIQEIFSKYVSRDVNLYGFTEEDKEEFYKQIPGMKTSGLNAFILKDVANKLGQESLKTTYRLTGNAISKCVPGFTKEDKEAIEARTGCESAFNVVPKFSCSLIYTLNEDGTLTVEFPAELIEYDRDEFIVTSIAPLRYFGCADMNNDGYIFIPDGSGAVIEYNDFYNSTSTTAFKYSEPVYGKDSCYATMTGSHNEKVTMPVYGLVNTVKSNAATKAITGNDTSVNGYFAIVEEGAALATINVESGGGTHKYATAYTSYTPYSFDRYELDNEKSYLVVSESRYEGSYKTRYTMLTDTVVAEKAELTSFYPTTYVGMAACYRDYLETTGQISKDTTYSSNLPLYIEALGSMDTTKKILTFPVTVSTPLTTFADVERMYAELSSAGASGNEIAITNINFKLSGFANGGMYYTYPAKVRWEKSLGGKKGLESLLSAAKAVNEDADSNTNFGIFPDFDFLYINNSASFDRVSNSKNGAKLVDNRYATKQTYSSVSRKYESLFAVLVATDGIDKLYTKFDKDYSKYSLTGLSVSTLGSDVNSNFDDKNPINREQAKNDIVALLDRMSKSYTLMTDLGNMYAIEFTSHIVNVTIDSSHTMYSSYAVPFVGMVLHSYVSYAGTPINYTGSVDYNILHSIENGATLYYILCTQNTNYLKDDEQLSKYFGVDYEYWKGSIKEQYKRLNDAIGSLQSYLIVNHSALIAERIANSEDKRNNYLEMINELFSDSESIIYGLIDAKLDELRAEGGAFGKTLYINIDKASVTEYACEVFNLGAEELEAYGFSEKLDALVATFAEEYSIESGDVEITFNKATIEAARGEYYPKYVTDSLATDGDRYVYTNLTCDNGSVVLVTYKDTSSPEGKTVHFILNYNSFKVNVRVDNTIDKSLADGETKVYTIGKCDFIDFGK